MTRWPVSGSTQSVGGSVAAKVRKANKLRPVINKMKTPVERPRGLGVRRPSAAFESMGASEKAAEGRRTPGRWRADSEFSSGASRSILFPFEHKQGNALARQSELAAESPAVDADVFRRAELRELAGVLELTV